MTTDKEYTLRINNVALGYTSGGNNITVASDINASLKRGGLTCLLGPNGAGKSTLLRTLTGFLRPLAGTIEIDGNNIDNYSSSEMSKLVSVVLTDRFNLPDMTARQLVALGRSPYTGFWGRLSDDDEREVDEVMALTGITDLGRRSVDTLSDGERQKVMIAKALAQHTPIILLDEPTAFLDYPSKVETMSLLHALAAERGKTVLLTTHDIEIALQLADRVWMLGHGAFIDGTPEDMMLSGRLADFFCSRAISFDATTATFRIALPTTRREVSLSGSGAALHLTARALRRTGYNVVETDDDRQSEISATDQGITLHGCQVGSIDELLQRL